MSQNKTVIPGLEQPARPYQGNGMPFNGQTPPQPNAYQRYSNPSQRATVIPGINQSYDAQQAAVSMAPAITARQKTVFISDKPVYGFLYSVSRTGAGEFWPLHQGPNSIGQSPDCDIQLLEGTVSFEHAILNVRMMKNPEKMIAFISDTTSTNGTMVNGESLGSAPRDCVNGDIITIGDNYELYLVLLDPATLGLKPQEKFIAVEAEEDMVDPYGPTPYPLSGQQTRDNNIDGPYSRNGYVPNNVTVGLDGTSAAGNRGGTVGY